MPSPPPSAEELRARVVEALGQVIDPEIGLDVVALGLVYGIDLEGARVAVRLTMTSPACPLGEHIALDAEQRVGAVDGVDQVTVELVWDPPWQPGRMSAEARQALGWDE